MRWYFGFFFVSGFCSLVYEVVWLRLAMAEFGVTTPLVSMVLSIFMAGLSLGSWAGGHLARRIETHPASSPLRLYGLTELLITVSGIIVPRELIWGRNLLVGLESGAPWGSGGYYLVSGGWIALSLLPFCACMGATFPLAMSAIRKAFGAETQQSFSFLYLANVLGATSGTVISAFFLVELLGFRGTLLVTAALNGALAASAFALSLPQSVVASPTARPSSARALPETPRRDLLWLLFVTGLISMALEVVWVRQFTPYLGTVVYAFAAILALYLAATFVGSQIYRVWVRLDHHAEHRVAWNIVWITLGVLGLIPLVTADPRLPVQLGFVSGVVRVALAVVPFCGVVGFLTPMLVDRWSSGNPARAGTGYAINVLGCIVGPLVSGFWLLPSIGERWTLLTLMLPLYAFSSLPALRAILASADPNPRGSSPWKILAGGVVTSLLLVSVTKGYDESFAKREVRRDYTATVIATGEGMKKHLFVNGVGTTHLTPITKMMAHLPLAFLETSPREGMVICFGMGTTFRSLLSWGIPSTAVELVPSVPLLFGYYHANGPELLRSPLARVVIDDGRRFLERSRVQYDVITLDPPPPVEAAGSSLLYSREFYTIVKRRLRPRGVLQQWLPEGDTGDTATLSSVAKALRTSFPHVRVFRSIEGWGFHFLSSMNPIPVTPGSVLASRLPPDAIADLLEWGPALTAEQQFSLVLERELPLETLIAVAPDVPALQDDRPINEYFFLRRMLQP